MQVPELTITLTTLGATAWNLGCGLLDSAASFATTASDSFAVHRRFACSASAGCYWHYSSGFTKRDANGENYGISSITSKSMPLYFLLSKGSVVLGPEQIGFCSLLY